MGNTIPPSSDYINSYKFKIHEQDNCRVAMWQLPYDSRYRKFDTDNSHWFESKNKYNQNEIDSVEKYLKISLSRYKVCTKTLKYKDHTIEEISKYPNGNQVMVTKTLKAVFVRIKDKFKDLTAEKIYNNESDNGRKIIYQHLKNGDNKLSIIKIYSYNTTKNKASDIVNFAYTSLFPTLTNGCKLEKEYYELNGQKVDAKKLNEYEYEVTDTNGQKLTFTVE